MNFDSLTYARRLKTAGFTETQAEALADANREMVVTDLATRDDIAGLKTDIAVLRTDITQGKGDLLATEQRLMTLIEHQTLRLTVRLGVMLAGGLSLMTAIVGVILRFH